MLPLEEAKYHLILSKDLNYLKEPEFCKLSDMCDEVGRMLYGFHKKLISYEE